ncbi:class I SAM-dependent methyltransferase [Alkalihalobacillus sp. CinArs1]|uniref:class I SAM-dependent methyltransferase n=1 Tax=Alkalihalobacillus sp. CinArs1 TaxID=2995314 RepID=UPI0022DDD630|nr:class I SAM-dependent methyltransferase [Alkalihalobacillus sp. CinArs1]
MNQSIEETYNKLARTYEKSTDEGSSYNAYYERPGVMSEIRENLTGMNVLDAGCSAGWYSEQFVGRGATVTGIDISEKMIQAAKRRVGENADFIQHDLTKSLPFKDESFDLIVSSLTLHYLKDWDTVFAEFKRVLKPGGELIFSVHHPFMDFTRFNVNDYFETTILTDTWKKPEVTIDVTFYRRAMQDIVNVVTRYFTLKKLIEPKPAKIMQEKEPKSYEYLMTNPHFLIVKACKDR